MRETEVLFFLIVVIMIRSRKTGNVFMINYLTSGFMYAKCANLILFFMSDPRLGLVYALLFLTECLFDIHFTVIVFLEKPLCFFCSPF